MNSGIHIIRQEKGKNNNNENAELDKDLGRTPNADGGPKLDGSLSMSYYSYERHERERLLFKVHKDAMEKPRKDDSSDDDEGRTLLLKTKSQAPATEPSTGRAISILAACMFIHLNAFGSVSALGVIYVELIRVFDAPRSQAALVQSVYTGMTLGGGVIFAMLITRCGVGTSVILTSLTGSVAFLVSAFAVNIPMIVVFVGVVAGASMSVHYLAGLVAVGWTFSANRKLALSILTFGPTIGQISFPYLTELLLNEYNWNGAFFIMGAFTLNSIACGLVLYFSKDFMKHQAKVKGRHKLLDVTCFKDFAFVVFMVTTMLYSSTGPVEQWFIVDAAVLNGLQRSQGTVIISLLGACGLIGRIIGSVLLRLCPTISSAVHLTTAFLFWGAAHALITTFKSFLGMATMVVMRGLSAGIVSALIPAIHLELRGVDRYPQTAAVCNFIGGFGQIIGGLAGGSSVDMTGSYNLIFYIAGSSSALCSLLMVVLLIVFKYRDRHNVTPRRSEYEPITSDVNV